MVELHNKRVNNENQGILTDTEVLQNVVVVLWVDTHVLKIMQLVLFTQNRIGFYLKLSLKVLIYFIMQRNKIVTTQILVEVPKVMVMQL